MLGPAGAVQSSSVLPPNASPTQCPVSHVMSASVAAGDFSPAASFQVCSVTFSVAFTVTANNPRPRAMRTFRMFDLRTRASGVTP